MRGFFSFLPRVASAGRLAVPMMPAKRLTVLTKGAILLKVTLRFIRPRRRKIPEGTMTDFYLLVALITMMQGGTGVGTATGFFYVKNNTTYLVTNRHVVIDEAKSHKPEALRLKLHTDARDLTKNVDRTIPLYNNGKARWHAHKDYPKVPVDVAVIEMERKQLEGTAITKLSSSSFLPTDKYPVAPGEDVIVLGFPRGLSDTKHNLGLLRNALISSAYGVQFQGVPMFLVDANLHPGMSGSPVMTKPRTMVPSKSGFTISQTPVTFFVGIFSSTLSAVLPSQQAEPLGLGSVWYAHLIEGST